MAKRKRTRREIIAGGAVLLAGGAGLAMVLDRITDPTLGPRKPAGVMTRETTDVDDEPVPPRSAARPLPQEHATPASHVADSFVMEEPLPGDVHVPASPPRSIADLVAPTQDRPQTLDALMGQVTKAEPPAASPRPPATAETAPLWLRNAQPLASGGGRPMVAIVVDDLGIDRARTDRGLTLDSAVTLAFMAYAASLDRWSEAARARGHEVLLHTPMEPTSTTIDPGPNALLTSLSEAENMRRLRWGLDRITGHVGINNHMGSRFTENAGALRPVLAEVKSRSLLFLDSRTSARTEGTRLSAGLGLVSAERNVFLDNEISTAGIAHQLAALKDVAAKRGTAIGIGHPHDLTLAALADWIPKARAEGFAVVPLTSVIRRQSAA